MIEGGRDVEDELFDLNKEPVERKRKRVEINSIDNGQQGFDVYSQDVGRVLRSKTMSMAECGKQAIDLKVVNIEVEEESGVSMPPKMEKKKDGRGRPRKIQGENGFSSLNLKEKSGVAVKQEKIDESSERTNRKLKKMKRGRGRPPKVDAGALGTAMEKEKVDGKNDKVSFFNRGKQKNDHQKKDGCGSGVKWLKADPKASGDEIVSPGKAHAESKDMGRREQQQLVRDQIVGMLKKAGWTIELRQRQQRDYKDAVYVDREGRTHWSVTLAYRKFKKKIDNGNADSIDVSAFSQIPVETLSTLFRVTEKGKKVSKTKKGGGTKTINRIYEKVSSKSKLSDRGISRSGQGNSRTLLARKPGEGSDGDYELYEGKRTLFSWMIDLGTIPLGGKVVYKLRGYGNKLLVGRITKDGICCDCCCSKHTIQDFVSHAGGKHGNPFCHIYVDSDNNLLQCLKNSWKKHLETNNIGFVDVDVDGEDPNDDTCNFCGDGGNLICCDSCPSTFHRGCLCIDVPSGDWHCVHCSCKFCCIAGETNSTPDDEDSFVSELFICLLCEEKFHVHCTQGNVAENFDYRDHPSFCSNECLKVFEHLQVIGIRYELEEGFTYTILQRRDECINEDCTIEEINSKLAVAFTIMDECFEPIIDERSGSNVIHSVVYNCGSNIRRLDFGGFYTIVLEKGDELVAAASIRIHGTQLAEMPFIGTRYMYRYQGMCRRLLNAIEKVLKSLGVEKLVIPAISELNETWTNKFGFVPFEESKRKELKYMSLIVFPGIDMLQKTVFEHGSHRGQMNPAVKSDTDLPDCTVAESVELEALHQNSREQDNDTKTSILDNSEAKNDGPENKVGAVESGSVRSSDEAYDSKNVPVNESPGEESCINDASRGSKSFLKDSASADCKLEAKQSDDGFRVPLVTGSL